MLLAPRRDARNSLVYRPARDCGVGGDCVHTEEAIGEDLKRTEVHANGNDIASGLGLLVVDAVAAEAGGAGALK